MDRNLNLISYTLASLLAIAPLNATHFTDSLFPQEYEQRAKEQDYIYLCNSIYKMHCDKFHILITKQHYFINLSSKQKRDIRKSIAKITEVIKVAQGRINDTRYASLMQENQRVYYSSLALRNILEEIIDDEFMNLIQGGETLADDIDILEYGKGIERAEKVLKVFA